MPCFRWLPEHVAGIAAHPQPQARPFTRAEAPRIAAGMDLWDHWPVLEANGDVAAIAGGALVIFLAAPVLADPEDRHAQARLWLFHRTPAGWRDLGPVFADGFSPGSREWSGTAIVDPAHGHVTLHFTAAGVRGEPAITFRQRLFATRAALTVTDGVPALSGWTAPVETLRPDGVDYMIDLEGTGAVGAIKAFRDPFVFEDPTSGQTRLLFAGSRMGSNSDWNGVVGAGTLQEDGTWRLDPPLVSADGLNNELERPHAIMHQGLVYLFWSTQRKVFAAGGPSGPTGLYGLVAPGIDGPWTPINGTGLVFGNPDAAPFQAYSWQVLPDLSVWSFADHVGLAELPPSTEVARAAFGGTAAPVIRLALDGDRASLAA